MKRKIIGILLAFMTVCTMLPSALGATAVSTTGKVYSDVTMNDWFYTYVTNLSQKNVICGYPDGTFLPQNTVTCGEGLKLILLASGYSAQTATDSNWASGYLKLAVAKGYLNQSEVKDLNAPISRLLIAQVAAKALGISQSQAASPFADTTDGYVVSLYEQGIIEGSSDGSALAFQPNESINRSQISAIVWRINNLNSTSDHIQFGSHTLNILKGVPVNSYDPTCFYTDSSGFLRYQSGTIKSKVGIDVSYVQGNIDWAKVKAAGVDFAIIRVGGRYYGSGGLYPDKMFTANIQGAQAAGLEVGVYYFSQATTTAEAKEEADYVLNNIKGFKLAFPVVFDWETSKGYRTYGLDTAILNQCATTFCSTIANAGYTPTVYFNMTDGYLRYDLRAITDYSFWLAQYSKTPTFYYYFNMWQYSSTGTVDGISGNVDMDIFFTEQ
jgi:GH25 family lysozyme M1 (1,4-beta-N-acetylmuramidase)